MALDSLKMRYFFAIATLGSMTLAAKELRVAQSALSIHMRSLEKGIGTRLLTRTSRGITLTAAGETLYVHVQSILRAMEQAEHATRDQGAHPSGTVVLGIIPSVCSTLGISVLNECKRRFPRICLSLSEGDSRSLRDALDNQSHDLSVTLGNVAKPSAINLFEEALIVVGPPGYFSNSETTKDLADVLKLPLIVTPERHGTRTRLESYAANLGISLNVAWVIEGLAATKAAIRNGMGCSIMAHSAVYDEIAAADLSYLRISGDEMKRHIVLDMAGMHPPTRATTEVQKLVVEVARQFG